MPVLLDTRSVAPELRRETFRAAMTDASGASSVELDDAPGGVSGRMAVFELGPSRVFRAESTGITLRRDRRAARTASPEVVALAVQGAGAGRHRVDEDRRLVRTGDLMVVDISRPFEFSWSGWGSSSSLQLPLDDLGVSAATAWRATTRLPVSPLYGLVRAFMSDLAENAARHSGGPDAVVVGEVGQQLARALLSTAGDRGAAARDAVQETLGSQVLAYVQQHLREPGLSAGSVAAALCVSRRHLHRVCAAAGFSLEQLVIARRLEGAKHELATARGRARPVHAVALSWGFKDPRHFNRRFRAAYGLSPDEWRHEAAGRAAP
ncbi:AraC family transcriptional regulator [Aquipuribacter sp. SD81]|uniref:AraC family transcriptional regulator n=1 Tax=Aquipuribacter sp. SD81 TaxID=3127703 RepID=UPI00301A46CD